MGTETGHINKQAYEQIQPIKADSIPQPLELEPILADTSIPERLFCGSPQQQTWKIINIENATIGRELAATKGWTGEQWTALLELWACESSWGHLKANYEGSGAFGIAQALPASKMASHGEDYLTNPKVQILWGLDYIASRYGNPAKALEFHYQNNWY